MDTAKRIALMYVIVAVLWALLLVTRSDAQEPTLTTPHDAVCKITNWTSRAPGAENDSCSGTLVAVAHGKGYVLLCDHLWHVTRKDSKGFDVLIGRRVGKPEVEFPNGHCSAGRLLQFNTQMDVSLVEISAPPTDVQPAKLVALRPEDGPFVVIGFPWDARGSQRWKRGDFARWRSPTNARCKMRIISGYSGGLLANRFGEGVGVASGNDLQSGESIYAAGDELLAFVERQVPKQ